MSKGLLPRACRESLISGATRLLNISQSEHQLGAMPSGHNTRGFVGCCFPGGPWGAGYGPQHRRGGRARRNDRGARLAHLWVNRLIADAQSIPCKLLN
jgi:hypothetical protein